MAKIYFVTDPEYQWLRNTSPHPIKVHKQKYQTAEHLFQSYKFMGYRPDIVKAIQKSQDPHDTAHLLDNEDDIRPNWYDINFDAMVLSVYEKFTQKRSKLAGLLLGTGQAELINNVMDPFWGVGGDKYDGENQFGKALMVVRNLLRTKSFPKGISLLQPSKILFYNRNEPYYGFTNFSYHPIDFNGIWKTSEHLFQAFKFSDPAHQHIVDQIYLTQAPSEAFDLAQGNVSACRPDWKVISIHVMRYIVWLKFQQNTTLHNELMSTVGQELIENSDKDPFWGCGADGKGQNKLGKSLMWIRNIFKYPGLPTPPLPPNPPIPTAVRDQQRQQRQQPNPAS